jgi:carbon storage regulator
MLVLSRKRNETIVIDGDIRIIVLDIRGNQVRLGIEAPDSVSILRQELRAGDGDGDGDGDRGNDAGEGLTGPTPAGPRRRRPA